MTKLITVDKTLKAHISKSLRSYRSSYMNLHVGLVSAIAFACLHGRTELMSTIYNGVTSNDRTAIRNYLRRISIIMGLGLKDGNIPVLDAEQINAAAKAGQVFTFSAKDNVGKFGLTKDNGDNRKALAKLCEDELIDPDLSRGYIRFMDKNNFDEIKTFGDDEITKAIDALVTKMNEPPENYEIKVSAPVRKALASVAGQLASIKASNEVHDSLKQ